MTDLVLSPAAQPSSFRAHHKARSRYGESTEGVAEEYLVLGTAGKTHDGRALTRVTRKAETIAYCLCGREASGTVAIRKRKGVRLLFPYMAHHRPDDALIQDVAFDSAC